MKKVLMILVLLGCACRAPAQGYVFFLHNMFLESADINTAHADYGKVEYREIVHAFEIELFTVISEIRPRNTDAKAYARKVARQIDSLIGKGVAAATITVVGTSKGGYIAQYTSDYLKNEQVNFVFIGSCSGDVNGLPGINYYGNILSIYEQSDVIGQSCSGIKNSKGSKIGRYKEIELRTGLKHGYLFKADPRWLQPAIHWAKQQYK